MAKRYYSYQYIFRYNNIRSSDNPMTVLKENTLWYKAAHN